MDLNEKTEAITCENQTQGFGERVLATAGDQSFFVFTDVKLVLIEGVAHYLITLALDQSQLHPNESQLCVVESPNSPDPVKCEECEPSEECFAGHDSNDSFSITKDMNSSSYCESVTEKIIPQNGPIGMQTPVMSESIVSREDSIASMESGSLFPVSTDFEGSNIDLVTPDEFLSKNVREHLPLGSLRRTKQQITALEYRWFFIPINGRYLKPPFRYSVLLAIAMIKSGRESLEVADIYGQLRECFPYFVNGDRHWKNSLRHVLSTTNWFKKTEWTRSKKKNHGWMLDFDNFHNLDKHCVFDYRKLFHCLSSEEVYDFLNEIGLMNCVHNKSYF